MREINQLINEIKTEASENRNGFYLAMICVVASIGGLLFGFDTAVISGTVGKVKALFELSELMVGWFTSSALIGCILGAMFAGTLGDRFGRKPILIIGSAMFFISALGSAIPPTFAVLISMRFIGGLGVGIASVLAPLFISEFSPPKLRGRLVAMYQLSIVVGILAAYFSNWILQRFSEAHPAAFADNAFFHRIMVSEVWRAMFGAEMIPAGLFFILLFLIPESPRWLIKAGFIDRGMSILAKISGSERAGYELKEIEASLKNEKGSIAELLKPGLRTALMVGIGLSVFGQMTGVNIVVYYGPSILEEIGFKFGGALQYQVLLGIINLIFTILALSIIDRLGRRPLLIGGMAVVVLTLATAGVLFISTANAGILIIVVLGAYMACVALSICAVIWVLTPEIFPNRIRGRAMSIATLSNWATNTLSAYLFPWYVGKYGLHTGFFTFAAICLLATLFFWRFVPETKGKSLEEIELMWTVTDNKSSM